MTKGHNQSHHKQSGQTPTNAHTDENRHLKNKQKDKSPEQGRSSKQDQSGGTKGQNAI
ncbi:hypothetical protein H8S95_14820 [Pontibacter sp. KCTC 32443]|uniref:hypothetical protein n=1 Tax=Pontibacter TaxID=323449 RepID=UPI00164DE00D|nr:MULTISPECIES: hypothetical protein [Pontibacter]MBC5775350.1 hypothetical protein [Pontibacter sp. KCTC 32443]